MSGDQWIANVTSDIGAEPQVLVDIRDTTKLDKYKSRKLRRWSSQRGDDSNETQTASGTSLRCCTTSRQDDLR